MKPIINLIQRAYARFLFWKWDRESEAAHKRMRGCAHERTMFVDVGSPPYDCIEKCRDCWALRLPTLGSPKLGGPWSVKKLEWTPNIADPRHSLEVAPPGTRAS
jgi:hypothetical protein